MPVPDRGDARAFVHDLPDVALPGEVGRAGVQTHAHADRTLAERFCASAAAWIAPGAVGNAMKKASPCVSTSTPPCRANASRRTRRCSASAAE